MTKRNGKSVKKVTIDELAIIINNGFNGQMAYMEKRFEAMDGKFAKLATKEQAQNLETKVDKIDERLKRVETVLTGAHVL